MAVTPTGIISVSAYPKGSKVYINGVLKGVTDLNVILPPGKYTVEVKKEGYTDWKKEVSLKGEIVMTLDTLLFPRNPSLVSLTNLGVIKAIPYHEGDKVILVSQNGDELKDGIYIYDSSQRPLSFYAPLKPLVLKKNLPADIDLNNTNVYFSPNSQEAIFEFTTETTTYSYLFSLGGETTEPFDISPDNILQSWKVEKNKEITKILETFPKAFRPIALENFSIIAFSPDQTKILYQANSDVTLPPIITPSLIGANQSPESRDLQKGKLYVYDKKEDKNFLLPIDENVLVSPTPLLLDAAAKKPLLTPTKIPTATPTPTIVSLTPEPPFVPLYSEKDFPIVWYDDSKHLAIKQERDIEMMDYDGQNKRTVYAGPFEKDFFYITNDGKLFILTNLNPQYNQYADLYEVGIQ
jgi:hypothetical protein